MRICRRNGQEQGASIGRCSRPPRSDEFHQTHREPVWPGVRCPAWRCFGAHGLRAAEVPFCDHLAKAAIRGEVDRTLV